MIPKSLRVLLSVLTIPGRAGWADCSTACPARTAAQLGTWAGVLGTSMEIPACLGPKCCGRAQGAPRDSSECWMWDRSRPGVRRGCGSGRARRPKLLWPLRRGGPREVPGGEEGSVPGCECYLGTFPLGVGSGQHAALGGSCPQGLSQAVLARCRRWQRRDPAACRVFISTRGTSDVCEVLCVQVFTRSGCCSGNVFEVFVAL